MALGTVRAAEVMSHVPPPLNTSVTSVTSTVSHRLGLATVILPCISQSESVAAPAVSVTV